MKSLLLAPFVNGLLRDCCAFQAGNFDSLRFGKDVTVANRPGFKNYVLGALAKRGFFRRRFNFEHASKALAHIIDNLDRYEAVYRAFADEKSRELFLELLRLRVLGPEHVRLSRNDEDFRTFRSQLACYKVQNSTETGGPWKLEVFEAPSREGSIRVAMHSYGFCITFLQEHYACRAGASTVAVDSGDVVLDAGACWGDTALYFADQAGKKGRVFAFEFEPANIELFQKNIAQNPALSERIELVRNALWKNSGEKLSFTPAGPSSTIGTGSTGTASVETIAIDDFVRQKQLDRLDFIKMDIEGAELAALEGARESMLRFRPKLAISLYHKPEDFFEIPEFILGLGVGYQLHLAHHTIHSEETVLFASARGNTH